MATNPSPSTIKRRITIRNRSFLMTQYQLTWERVMRRLPTMDEVRSPEWQEDVKAFEAMFLKWMNRKVKK